MKLRNLFIGGLSLLFLGSCNNYPASLDNALDNLKNDFESSCEFYQGWTSDFSCTIAQREALLSKYGCVPTGDKGCEEWYCHNDGLQHGEAIFYSNGCKCSKKDGK